MKTLLFSVTKKDFIINWFSGTGAGGQHRNKHQNCCRLVHPESGATATGQNSRSREDNLRDAFKKLIEKDTFKIWMNRKIWEITQSKTIEELVQDAIKPENLKIEGKGDDGRWKPYEYGGEDDGTC